MPNTDRVKEILSWYGSDNPGTLGNLARIMNTGRLAGTGKFVILPVDQGFEHGPARSFGPNPPAYNPLYHYRFAIEAGCNAYAAPLGFLEAGAREFAGEIPLILKVNDHDLLHGDDKDPDQAITGSVQDALRIGAAAVGFTIYPGSEHAQKMYGQIRAIGEEAKRNGLAVVIWSYPRGSALSKEGETAIDVCGYAAHIAAQLGANIVKVKIPDRAPGTGGGEERLRKGTDSHRDDCRAHQPRREMHVRRAADRDLLGWRVGVGRQAARTGARRAGGRRVRVDHRAQ